MCNPFFSPILYGQFINTVIGIRIFFQFSPEMKKKIFAQYFCCVRTTSELKTIWIYFLFKGIYLKCNKTEQWDKKNVLQFFFLRSLFRDAGWTQRFIQRWSGSFFVGEIERKRGRVLCILFVHSMYRRDIGELMWLPAIIPDY